MRTAKPRISIIIPVYYEGDRINTLIDHLRFLDERRRCEIIVVDGEPSRSTINKIVDSGVKRLSSDKGRGRQMNVGAAEARGEILLFLHADTFLPENGLDRVVETIDAGEHRAGAFGLRFDGNGVGLSMITFLASIRLRLSRIPFGDNTIFVSRSYFMNLGGFQELPMMEDVDFSRRIRQRGDRIRILPEKVTTSPRRLEQTGLLSGLIRVSTLLSLYLLGVPPRYLKKYYADDRRPRSGLNLADGRGWVGTQRVRHFSRTSTLAPRARESK